MSIFRRRLMIANALKKSDSNINYPGLIAAWSAAGKSNDDADRDVLRDLTGNGHDITLNNFAFSEMSGYGGYAVGENNGWFEASAENKAKFEKYEFNNNKIHIKGPNGAFSITGVFLFKNAKWESFKIKYNSNNPDIKVKYRYVDENDVIQENNILVEGINVIQKSYGRFGGSEFGTFIGFKNFSVVEPDFECTIELLPEYPDALVFDGVDDYGYNNNMPTLTDYTIIAEREFLNPSNWGQKDFVFISYTKSLSYYRTGDLFSLESRYTRYYAITFATQTPVSVNNKRSIVYQNKTNYNGKDILCNEMSSEGFNTIRVGRILNNYTQMAFYSAYLFDRSLDEQEIRSFIRKYIDADYLLPSEIPTPDCYYDFTNGDNTSETRETIVDLSGNGNDAKAYNFAWNEEGSGYKDGALQFDGTDDYISLEAFDSGFQTILMLCNYSTSKILYDQRNDEHQFSSDARFVIFAQGNSVAYNWGNVGGVTYINGKLNSSVLANETVLKKHCICINNPTVTSEFTTTPKIGGPSTTTSTAYAKMSVFKFLGFKEELTEEQIQYVIKKYNLLDGVDEIEIN